MGLLIVSPLSGFFCPGVWFGGFPGSYKMQIWPFPFCQSTLVLSSFQLVIFMGMIHDRHAKWSSPVLIWFSLGDLVPRISSVFQRLFTHYYFAHFLNLSPVNRARASLLPMEFCSVKTSFIVIYSNIVIGKAIKAQNGTCGSFFLMESGE